MKTSTLLLATSLAFSGAALAADGAAVFSAECAKCHGATGQSDTPAGKSMKVPALAGSEKIAGKSADEIVALVKGAKQHDSLAKKLSAEDLTAAAAHAKDLAAKK